jgi:hypothetical protein
VLQEVNKTEQAKIVPPEPAKQEDITFKLEPLGLKESEFPSFFQNYLKQVDSR